MIRRLSCLAALIALAACDRHAPPSPTEAPSAAAEASGDVAFYTCPMHPSVHQPGPGSCPICGMDLVPVTREESASGAVIIDAARRQKVGIATSPAQRQALVSTRAAYGVATVDPAGVTLVSPRVSGTVDRLVASAPGQRVSRGATLATLVSPELIQAQSDLLQSRGTAAESAALSRLRLWQAPDALVERLRAGGEPETSVALLAPRAGVLTEVMAVSGGAFEMGMPLFELADLDPLWIEARIYADDQGTLSVGQTVQVLVPGEVKAREGRVLDLPPELDANTRARLARISVPNPDLGLLPGQSVDVRWRADLGARLTVPADAVIYAGARRLVFVDQGEGRLSPREVQIGARTEDLVEILSGLTEGEPVVSSGTFLVAAESRIRSATKIWGSAEVAPAAKVDSHVH